MYSMQEHQWLGRQEQHGKKQPLHARETFSAHPEAGCIFFLLTGDTCNQNIRLQGSLAMFMKQLGSNLHMVHILVCTFALP